MVSLLAVLLPGLLLLQEPPAGWSKTILAPGLAISLPPGVKPDPDNKKQQAGFKMWSYSAGPAVFQVQLMADYEKSEPGVTPDRIAVEYLSGILGESKKATVKRQRDIVLNGWPGLDDLLSLDLKDQGSFAMWVRTYVVAGSLYSVSVMYAPEFGRPATAEPFLNSLSLEGAAKPGPLTSPGPTFTTFAPKGGGFSIGMPATPTQDELPTGTGPGKSILHRFKATYGNRVYTANYLAFPTEAPDISQGERNEGLKSLVDSAVKGMDAKEVGTPTSVTRGGLEIVRVDCARADGVVGRIEATVVGRRVFASIMLYPSGHAGSPDIEAFFNSFKMIPPEPEAK